MTQPIILFVDDKPVTHAYFRDEMKQFSDYSGYDIRLAFDLADAIELLETEPKPTIAAVIIDLGLPGEIPKQLQSKFEHKYIGYIQLNEGQILGMYLYEINIPYMYLSAYSERFKPTLELNTIANLDKDCDWNDFKSALDKLLNRGNMP